MEIKVTEKHIKSGIPCNDAYCPVALAIMEATGCDQASVYPIDDENTVADLGHPISRNRVLLPRIVDSFASSYDKGIKVNPFSFELDLED